jgi:hypothetical protein
LESQRSQNEQSVSAAILAKLTAHIPSSSQDTNTNSTSSTSDSVSDNSNTTSTAPTSATATATRRLSVSASSLLRRLSDSADRMGVKRSLFTTTNASSNSSTDGYDDLDSRGSR